mmetsp:Transcript_19294/g.41567  ORF Transcript_19294/g.41567 Transcript_19294/m.41567 type:complete len:762 (-) Transcript_19294:125-2410(-)|eukprot:CAMPEP_0206455346 /NCGR_PEP_ID=MMETSP0324_2-20121206/21694_1 /ASSEMBLY_ACC=CAM_ASM_000836 /TAXON_ID=2866 /ORGANISM="Crypthecodinium cohnii, Strain Seligo" /LENGTH=761 /DNA_ID=CAMNT_0053926025 /DNA_START=75 /DNA_END=2360 /DNA_ORIENTATION=-
MSKRYYGHSGHDSSFSNKRARNDDGNVDLAAAVSTILAAASSGRGQEQLASLLGTVFDGNGSVGGGGDYGGHSRGSSSYSSRHGQASSRTSSRGPGGRVSRWDAVVIPAACVGWLKGRQGGTIREIEAKSGATVEVDQSTKEMGHCTVHMHGSEECKRKAYGFVVAEMLKVADQPHSNMDCSAIGTKLTFELDPAYVGWVKGPKGKVVQDITNKSLTRVDVDQTGGPGSRATVNIYGTHDNVAHAKELIAFELNKVSPEASAEVNALRTQAAPQPVGSSGGGSGSLSLGLGGGSPSTLQIPASFVGWLKGKQGQMIREIEVRSEAGVEIDQTTKDAGYCTVHFHGGPSECKKARGFVVAEILKVADQSGQSLDPDLGVKLEISIDESFVGWVKGPKGKVVQDITLRSCTRVDVDQKAGGGRALVRIYGTHENVAAAKDFIAHEISKVSPEAGAEINGIPRPMTPLTALQLDSLAVHPGGGSGITGVAPPGTSSLSSSLLSSGFGQHDSLKIPSSYVGWIKGKQGSMIREIEHKSGAVVDVDQSTQSTGAVTVNFRGTEESKKRAFGFVMAEAIKVAHQPSVGTEKFDYHAFGTMMEFEVENQYVGWIKGPRGKVIQDISNRSATRVDMDQNNPHLAMVKIYGTYEGVDEARQMVASELSKVNPEAARHILGEDSLSAAPETARFPTPPPPPRASPQPQMQAGLPDLASTTAALASALQGVGGLGGDPNLASQQAAAAQLAQSFLQQLATVAPGMMPGVGRL